jgi:hypothetical protein
MSNIYLFVDLTESKGIGKGIDNIYLTQLEEIWTERNFFSIRRQKQWREKN